MDLAILSYGFMQNAILAALLGGVACSIVGVFVVDMGISFIGMCLSHAALVGCLISLFLGIHPLIGAFLLSLFAVAIIGPLTERGEFNPDTPIGIFFCLMLGVIFLLIGILPGPKTEALSLLWGSILTVTHEGLVFLGLVAAGVLGLVFLFYKEIQAVLFNKEIALAVGVPASLIFYGILVLTGATVSVSLPHIGGLLIFGLIINPAATAYQLTYNLKRMFLLSSLFGVLSCWLGVLGAYLFDFPCGATIIIVSSIIFGIATAFSPKRKVKQLDETELRTQE